ncbi:hypothetical protein [Microbacterium sp. 22296]|uniref:hypothetical protein n=1 Tax=Microbacterium sp. 22296 TaxID=3453903 RepID=UPI003F8498A1
MSGFLIEYHRPTGVNRVQEFRGADGPRRALLCRLELEAQRTDRNWEIVSLNSDSLETLQRTHSRYFDAGETGPVITGD